MRLFNFFTIIIICISCSKKSTNITVVTQPTTPVSTINPVKTYLALGDSYTIGQGVQVAQRFPAQTVALLKGMGINISDPLYIAQTGWTTASLQGAISAANPSPTYDVVTLLVGVNDQYQRMDTGGYATRFTQLLQKSVQLAAGKKDRVFVLSIPDYSVTPFVSTQEKERVSREIDLFNTVNRRITVESGISYTDITPSTREAATNPSLIASDNLHPSGSEYKKWADALAPKISAVLK